MDAPKTAEIYDAYYYTHGCGRPYQRDDHWLQFFDVIADRLVSDIGPASVLDAGCAMAFLVEKLRERGVAAFGVDISEYAIANVHPDIKPFCWVGSIAAPLPQRYDLIVSIEVLEHMPQDEAERAVANLCQSTHDILFSSTPLDYKEVSHLNVHSPEYWATLFARHSFYRDVDFDASFITPWATRFRRRNDPPPRLISDYERRFWLLWKENTDLRSLALDMRAEMARLHQEVARLHQEQAGAAARLIVLERADAGLKAQVADKDRGLIALNKRAAELEAIVAQKNEHIGYLEKLIRQIESGRVMRALRALHSWRHARPTPAAAPQAPVVDVPPEPADVYQAWIARTEPDAVALLKQREAGLQLARQPLISIITPVFDPPPQVLREMIESVLAQSYGYWELCLADGGSAAPGVREVLEEYARRDARIRVRYLPENLGIAGNSNAALELATGDYVVLLDHDDLIAPNLLFEAAALLNHDASLDVIYYDEDKISEDGRIRREPWFKPSGWSPDLLLSTNYMMHCVVRRSLLAELGGFDPQMNGAQDWDLSLRLAERTRNIAHIPKVLYHWRQIAGSAARDANAKPWAFAAQEGCITAHLRRIGVRDPKVSFPALGRVRVHWPNSGAKVSIIIPTKDKLDLLKPCLTSIFERTACTNYEVVLVDTGSAEPATRAYYAELASDPRVKIVELGGPFNYSAANNAGAAHASGEVLILLNNDTEVLEADWIDELAGWAERPEIGVVGCKLIRPDGTIQHAGIAMGVEGHGSHVFDGDRENDYGPFGTPEWYRDYQAVTGACMAVRRAVFEQLGGLDELYQVGYNDIDFCLRAVQAGYRVAYTPFARLLHHEGGSRGFTLPPSDVLRATVKMSPQIRAGDPFWSPNLAQMRRRPTVAPAEEDSRGERLLQILKVYGLLQRERSDLAPFVSIDPGALERAAGARQTNADRSNKLLMISHDLSFSGAPLVLFMLGFHLKEQGYTIAVASPTDGPLRERYVQAGMQVFVDSALIDDARVAMALLAGYDVAIVNTILNWRSVYAARAAGRPCIWWVHESQFGQDLAQRHPRIAGALAAADAVMFPARTTAARYTAYVQPDRGHVLHYGIDMRPLEGQAADLAQPAGVTTVVVLASLEPRKGQDVLIRALAALPEDIGKRIECLFVGRVLNWDFYRDLMGATARLGNVRIVGEVPHERAAGYLRAADIFVLPSRDEVLPISILEAMRYGKPMIVTNVGGITEVVQDRVNGLVVPAEDAQALAAALAALVRDPDLMHRLGRSAQATFEDQLTIERFGGEVEQLIERVSGRLDAPLNRR